MRKMFNFQLVKERIDEIDKVATKRTQISANTLQRRFSK